MRVIALVSGGKDSCYNALLCQHHGHEIVALGNLLPKDIRVEELDSYMYQTVGHGLLESYAECTGLPLFRRKIMGVSQEQGLVYTGSTHDDEVEDLTALLSFAVQQMPEIQAVSTGAIASDYQRTRVERVCSSLGLVSLAYMWHQPQSQLLESMIRHDIHAILIKVAAAGLHPNKHLGKSIAELQGYLHSLRDMYGINVCGEGGEYETLTLDCPFFTRGRIVIDASDICVVSNDSLAPVAWMKPTKFHVELKDAEFMGTAVPGVIWVPDAYTRHVGTAVGFDGEDETNSNQQFQINSIQDVLHENILYSPSHRSTERYAAFSVACFWDDTTEHTSERLSERRAGIVLNHTLHLIKAIMHGSNNSMKDAVFVTMFVKDMSHFVHLNSIHGRHFPQVNPPARATLQLSDGLDCILSLEVLCMKTRTKISEKKVLHVQSISSWAPSCIGPYAQAVDYNGIVHFAGQIPLDPSSMDIVSKGSQEQFSRVIETCNAVSLAMRIDFQATRLWSIIYVSSRANAGLSAVATKCLELNMFTETSAEYSDDENGMYCEEYIRAGHPISPMREWQPLVLVVESPELPKNSLVELQSVHASCEAMSYIRPSDSSSEDEERAAQLQSEQLAIGWVPFLQNSREVILDGIGIISSLKSYSFLLKSHVVICGLWEDDICSSLVGLLTKQIADAGLQNSHVAFIHLFVSTSTENTVSKYQILTIRERIGNVGNVTLIPVDKVCDGSQVDKPALFAVELFAKR